MEEQYIYRNQNQEFWEFSFKGTDPEDHLADDQADFLDEEFEECHNVDSDAVVCLRIR